MPRDVDETDYKVYVVIKEINSIALGVGVELVRDRFGGISCQREGACCVMRWNKIGVKELIVVGALVWSRVESTSSSW